MKAIVLSRERIRSSCDLRRFMRITVGSMPRLYSSTIGSADRSRGIDDASLTGAHSTCKGSNRNEPATSFRPPFYLPRLELSPQIVLDALAPVDYIPRLFKNLPEALSLYDSSD